MTDNKGNDQNDNNNNNDMNMNTNHNNMNNKHDALIIPTIIIEHLSIGGVNGQNKVNVKESNRSPATIERHNDQRMLNFQNSQRLSAVSVSD